MTEPPTPSARPPEPPPAKPPGKGLAVAGLACGILGFATCGVSALLGLVLGILALVKSGQAPGAGRVRGLSIAAVAVSGAMLLIDPAVGLPLLGLLVFFRHEIKPWITDIWDEAVEQDRNDFFDEPMEGGGPLPLRLCPAVRPVFAAVRPPAPRTPP
jgi:hypothetical protein